MKDADGNDVVVTLTVDDTYSTDNLPTSEEIGGLAPGDYYVKETNRTSKYAQPAQEVAKVTVEAGKIGKTAVNLTYQNRVTTGAFVVEKTVESDLEADKTQKFAFKVTLTDTKINGKFGEMAFVNGVARFELADNEFILANHLPVGIGYTVEEFNVEGFVTKIYSGTALVDESSHTVSFRDKKEIDSATGTIASGIAGYEFNNKRRTGGFELSKELVSDLPADADKEFSFVIKLSQKLSGTFGDVTFSDGSATIALKGGAKATVEGLPFGVTYTITEASEGAFTTTQTVNSTEVLEVKDLKVNATFNHIAFKNTRTPGGLQVTKSVSAKDESAKKQKFNFRVTLYTDAAFTKVAESISKEYPQVDETAQKVSFDKGVAEFKLGDGESVSIANLPSSIYYVVEELDVAKGWVVTKTGDTGQIKSNDLAKALFTNTKDEGALNVYKSVVSNAGSDKTKDYRFVVTIYKEDGVTLDTSIDGTYGNMDFSQGVAIFTLKDGQNKSATGLPNGVKYVVQEVREDDTSYTYANYNYNTYNPYDGDYDEKKTYVYEGYTVEVTDGKGQLFNNTQKAARFTNTRVPGKIVLKKEVVSPVPADKDAIYLFDIELSDNTVNGTFDGVEFKAGKAEGIALQGGNEREITGLPAGVTFRITEVAVANMTTTATVNGQAAAEQEGVVVATGKVTPEGATVIFRNDRNTGGFKLKKIVTSDTAADAQKKFVFTITLSDNTLNGSFIDATFKDGVANVALKGGDIITVDGLPIGITYSIEETTDNAFVTTFNGKVTNKVESIDVAPAADEVTHEVTNTRKPGGFDVTKSVESTTDADKQKDFRFIVTLYTDSTKANVEKSINGTSGVQGDYGVEFVDGVAEFTLKDGQTKEIRNLPVGTYYVVEEETAEGFITTSTGEAGTISTEIAKATFKNKKDEGGLVVSKKVVSDVAADKAEDKTYHFVVTLYKADGTTVDTSFNQVYGDMTFKNGVAEFDLADGAYRTAIGLPKGTKYGVVEQLTEADGKVMTTTWEGITDGKGAISDNTAIVTATNTRKKGNIEVQKTVRSLETADSDREFVFTIELSDTGISGKYGDVNFTDGKATFKLKKDQKVTIKGLPVGVQYTIAENVPGGFECVTTGDVKADVTEGTKVVKFANNRLYTGFSIKKEWDDDDNHDGFRPDEIQVQFLANGKVISTVPLRKAEGWYYESPRALPVYDDAGNKIQYSWSEDPIAQYTIKSTTDKDATFTFNIDKQDVEVSGTETTITNEHIPVPTIAQVQKVWDDNDDNDGKRQEELTVRLAADGKTPVKDLDGNEIADVTLSKANNWTSDIIKNLPKYKSDGTEIAYTWEEVDLSSDYTRTGTAQAVITWEAPDGEEISGYKTTLTNSYDTEFTTASVKKVWVDRENKAGFRSESIEVELMADYGDGKGAVSTGKKVTLSKANNWNATLDQLPAYKNQKQIVYSWNEGGRGLQEVGRQEEPGWHASRVPPGRAAPERQVHVAEADCDPQLCQRLALQDRQGSGQVP